MPSGTTTTWRRRAAVLISSAVASTLVVAPAVAAPADEPPTILSAVVSPSGLPSEGGLITITAEVVDDLGVARVDATVSSPEGASGGVALLPTGPTTFRGTFLVGSNGTDSSVNWNVEIWATDTNGSDAMVFTGGVEVAGQPQFDEPPILWDPVITPSTLPTEGGTVTIAVSAWDLRGIADGTATVTAPDGTASSVELQPVAADRFEVTFIAPPNATAVDVRYGATVAVHDDIGQETSADAGSFTVAGRPPAVAGALTVCPAIRVFRPLPLGGSAARTVVVRNTGAPGRPAVQATVAVAGRSFSLAGDGSLVLEPGQSATLRITFSPGRSGVDLGRLTVRRADRLQPRLGAVLLGVAVRPR